MWPKLRERLAVAAVILTLLGLPLSIYSYQKVYVPSKYPKGAQIINLYGIAGGGRWVATQVNGINYWWKDFQRANVLRVDKNRPVVLRVTSTDVLHSFAIPSLREYRRPVPIEAGKWKVFELTPEEDDQITFLCWQYCSGDHVKMNGTIVVGGEPSKLTEGTFLESGE